MLDENQLVNEVQRRQLSKLGHSIRKPQEALVNRYALYVPGHGQRKPGRPKTTFKDYVAQTISPQLPLTENEIRQGAMDRDHWKTITNNAQRQ